MAAIVNNAGPRFLDIELSDSQNLVPYKSNRCCSGRLWYIRDPCGIFSAAFTWLLLSFAIFVVVRVIIIPSPDATLKVCNATFYIIIAALSISSHLRTMFTDPGAVPIDNPQISESGGDVINMPKCVKCGCIKPAGSHHCSTCQRCIRRMDHHCPWVNNCVGENNLKFFVLFAFYTAVMCCYTLLAAVTKFKECTKAEWRKCPPYTTKMTLLLLLLVSLEALTFGLFTVVVFTVQIINILENKTYIDKLKKEERYLEKRPAIENFRAVFGWSCWSWLSPFSGRK